MSSRHVLELGPDDWNSPLDDHLFIVADTHTHPATPARAKRNSHLGNVARSEPAREILAHLAAAGDAREGLEIANAVGRPYDSVRQHLAAFVRNGMVTKPYGGGYAITAAGRAAVAPGSGV